MVDEEVSAWELRQPTGSDALVAVGLRQLPNTQTAQWPLRPPKPSTHEHLPLVLEAVQWWEWGHWQLSTTLTK